MKLSDVCEFIVDCPHSTAKDEGIGYPLIRTPNIGKGRLILDDVHRVSKEVYDKRNARAVPQDDDLILAREAPAGNVAIIKNGEKVCLGQRTVLIRPDKEKVYPDFLAYYILAPEQQYELLGTANGATVAHVNIPVIKALPIELPEMEKQIRAAGALKAYDDLIENGQRQIKLLEEAAQRLYKEWFINLRFPGHEGITNVDGVPSGWEKQKIMELTSVLRRGISPTYNDEGKYTVINQKCIRSSIMSLDEARRQEKEYPDEINLQDADTVICSTGTGTLGRVGQVCGDYPETTIDSHVTLVRAKRYANLLYHSIKANQEYLMGMGRGSTNQQELYRNVIEETEVLWPSQDIAARFEEIAQLIHRKITVLDRMVASSIEARDRLLPKLMSGEIEL